jgi:hypothetical protein
MSTHQYHRALDNGIWDVEPKNLSLAVRAALPGLPFKFRAGFDGNDLTLVEFDFVANLDPGQVATLDATVAAHKGNNEALAVAKQRKFEAIDNRTSELIHEGFDFNGVTLSLSERAQIRIEGTDRARNDAAMVYPIVWNSLDDSVGVQLANATDVHNMYLTALGTLRARVDSGSVLKDQVRAAVTVAEVEAIVDNR